jgi:hypothetical protein
MANAPFYEIGRYACKVVSQALGESSTGKPQFALRFQVMGQVDPADPSRFIPARQQYERTHYRAITEKTIPYFIEDLKVLGFQGDSFRGLDSNTEGFHDFRGQDVDMWCSHEPDQEGNQREKWGIARQGGSLELKALEPKKVRELDNLYGKHLKGMKANGVPKPATAPAQAVPTDPMGIMDDDVPF